MGVLPLFLQGGLGAFQQAAATTQLHLLHHKAGQNLQRLDLFGADLPWLVIHGAEAAHGQAIGRNQRKAGVEADVWWLLHQRVVAEARILQCVLNDQR